MKKQEILDRINSIIQEEKGNRVPITGKFIDSNLDSLGIVVTLITIDAEFPILGEDDNDGFDSLDIPNLTMRDLVTKCRLSITNPSSAQSSKKAI